MSKDPAFLFYPNDWMGGTMCFTLEQKGAYLELLVLQFNMGRFTEAQAKQVLSICFSSVWQVVSKKFKTDGTLWWNERLENEVKKRKEFCESRRNNAKGKTIDDGKKPSASAKHMLQHMENENENDNIDNNNTLYRQIEIFKEKHEGKYTEEMYSAFINHWTQRTMRGKDKGIEKWKTMDTWSIGGRLATWFKKSKNYDSIDGKKRFHVTCPTGKFDEWYSNEEALRLSKIEGYKLTEAV